MNATTIAETPLLPVAIRDTARIVTALARESLPFETLREQCNAQVAKLRAELGSSGLAGDAIDDAVYAQCALLDEAALKHLTGSARNAWEHEPLQVTHFSSNDAGEELVRRIERRLHEPQPVRPLLAIFAAVLALGFVGRFAVNGSTARVALMRTIDERLGRAATTKTDIPSAVPIVVNHSSVRRLRISPLTWVAAACVAVALLWFGANQWFIATIARLTQ
ncbi:hypothetical protein WK60_09110 [Burkholderia ubonensis]|uniref:DotU/TssL family secretion system protein n=1 Tax=Burkholderia ubonensis TaxID=101571 RepID=UPI00075CA623|nr:DotU/TssL family secretion system protein [Burkholderia ubonensis]KVT96159.1 hypothetical protein WK60_09110 [Burkholderia ubonensis]